MLRAGSLRASGGSEGGEWSWAYGAECIRYMYSVQMYCILGSFQPSYLLAKRSDVSHTDLHEFHKLF